VQTSSAKKSPTGLTKKTMGSSQAPRRRPRPEGPEVIDGVFKLLKAESVNEAAQFFADSSSKEQGVWIISGPAAMEMNFDLETTVPGTTNGLSSKAPRGMKFCVPISSNGGVFEMISEFLQRLWVLERWLTLR
jgi:hypothetical protein